MDKFLKLPSTENGHISHLVTQYGLAFPEVKFHLIIIGRTSFRSPGNGTCGTSSARFMGWRRRKGCWSWGQMRVSRGRWHVSH
ncbi:hypothetical protein M1O52_01540 [Dehalococcoidia bacterium]|nr:hypothetical protein [Dehalococcoidia bacterium]